LPTMPTRIFRSIDRLPNLFRAFRGLHTRVAKPPVAPGEGVWAKHLPSISPAAIAPSEPRPTCRVRMICADEAVFMERLSGLVGFSSLGVASLDQLKTPLCRDRPNVPGDFAQHSSHSAQVAVVVAPRRLYVERCFAAIRAPASCW